MYSHTEVVEHNGGCIDSLFPYYRSPNVPIVVWLCTISAVASEHWWSSLLLLKATTHLCNHEGPRDVRSVGSVCSLQWLSSVELCDYFRNSKITRKWVTYEMQSYETLKWNTAHVPATGTHVKTLTLPKQKEMCPCTKTQSLCHLLPLPKTPVPFCLSAEPQSNILWVVISEVFPLMLLLYSVFTLTTRGVLVWALRTDILASEESGAETEARVIFRLKHRSELSPWTRWEVFVPRSGLDTCSPFSHMALFSQVKHRRGAVVNWLWNKEKRILCSWTVLFFFAHTDLRCGAQRLFLLSASSQLTFHCKKKKRKKKSECRFLALCFSSFQNAAKSRPVHWGF